MKLAEQKEAHVRSELAQPLQGKVVELIGKLAVTCAELEMFSQRSLRKTTGDGDEIYKGMTARQEEAWAVMFAGGGCNVDGAAKSMSIKSSSVLAVILFHLSFGGARMRC